MAFFLTVCLIALLGWSCQAFPGVFSPTITGRIVGSPTSTCTAATIRERKVDDCRNRWTMPCLLAQVEDDVDEESEDDLSLEAFQRARDSFESTVAEDEEFDGYKLRDVIYAKWGSCYDVDFNRVDSFGFRKLYLNILPFKLGRRPFRHETELDYLCHLQAVVEILQKYDQLEYVLYQISETSKKPRAGTSPLVCVPLRLDLTPEQVKQILRY